MMKRAAEALRRQDWAAVVIEFLMVVAGVLLAFQISEWATGRDEARVRRESVDRLLHESEQDVAVLQELVTDQKEQVLGKMLVAAANLRNPSPPAQIVDDFRAGIARSAVMPKPPAPDSVYQELIASGRFGATGDIRMRDAVSAYASAMKYLDQAIDYARMGTTRPLESESIKVTYDPSSERHRRVDIDFRALAADQAVQNQFLARLSVQQFVIDNYGTALSAAKLMCQEVARVAGKPCRP